MRFSDTVLILLPLIALISLLNYRLLLRLFRFYQGRFIKYFYLFSTVATIGIIGFGLPRRPLFVVPEFAAYRLLVYCAVIWLVGQIILLVLQPFISVAHRLIKVRGAADPPQNSSTAPVMTRREFLHNTLAITPVVALGISAKGVYEAQCEMAVQRYSLVFPALPPNLSGFKIAQVSDTHLGPYFDLARLDTVIQLLGQEKPDMVVITGDFADDLKLLRPAIDRLNNLQPNIPYGIYYCYGNHDYFQNFELIRTEFHNSRIETLENSSKLIVPGPQPFFLMGVDYPWTDTAHTGISVSVGKRQEYFTGASRNVPAKAFKVLIAHHPDFLYNGFAAQIPLTLTGHTHGGQVVIAGKPILSSYNYMRGLYKEQGVYGYVSSGAGHWFPMRLGCPPEISLFTLQA